MTVVIDGLAFGKYQHIRPIVPADVFETVAACAHPALERLSVTVPFSDPLAPYSHVHATRHSLEAGVIVADGFADDATPFAAPFTAIPPPPADANKNGFMIWLLT